MELGMIGLGRMGTNMVRRLQRAGHQRVVYDLHPEYGIMAAYAEGLNILRHANAGKRRRTDLAKFAGRVADSGEGAGSSVIARRARATRNLARSRSRTPA